MAKKTDLSEQIAIDLSTDLASVKAIIKLDEDFPFLGGKSLTVSAGAKLAYESGRPIVILKGVKLWGVPLPNAWLGDLKNIDLVKEFGGDEGFWQSFADGIEHIKVSEGVLNIKLKEWKYWFLPENISKYVCLICCCYYRILEVLFYSEITWVN